MAECVIEFEGTAMRLTGPTYETSPGASYLTVLGDAQRVTYTTTEAVAGNPEVEITRILEALSPGRPANIPASGEWDAESGLTVAGTDRQLRFTPGDDGELVSYLRVTGTDGQELVYWNSDEWQEDPELVLGALLGALQHGPARQ